MACNPGPVGLKTASERADSSAIGRAHVTERCAKVDHWQHSSQRQRWHRHRAVNDLLTSSRVLRKVISCRNYAAACPGDSRDASACRELKIDTRVHSGQRDETPRKQSRSRGEFQLGMDV